MLEVFQFWSLLAVLFTSSEKVSRLSRPLKTGQPRYLPKLSWCLIEKTEDNICQSWELAFLEKVRKDFWRLISCPDCWPKKLRMIISFWHDSRLVRQKRRLSSANKRHGNFSAWGEILNLIPLFFLEISVRSTRVSTSMHIRKWCGDNGSPCCSPLVGVKKPQHFTIHYNWIWHCGDTLLNPLNPFLMKP